MVTYLDELNIRTAVESLTAHLFPDSPAFRLAGDAGRQRLLAALAQPRWNQYHSMQAKAATLHFHLNRDHPYIDGNKRLALVAMELFLAQNGGTLAALDDELRDLALGVADGSISATENRRFILRRTYRDDWTPEQVDRWTARLREEDLQPTLDSLRQVGGPRLDVRMQQALMGQMNRPA